MYTGSLDGVVACCALSLAAICLWVEYASRNRSFVHGAIHKNGRQIARFEPRADERVCL